MGYRKIVVDNTTYEYTVGRTHIKVRGMGAVQYALEYDPLRVIAVGPRKVAALITQLLWNKEKTNV